MRKTQGIVNMSYKVKQTLIYVQSLLDMRQTSVKHKVGIVVVQYIS